MATLNSGNVTPATPVTTVSANTLAPSGALATPGSQQAPAPSQDLTAPPQPLSSSQQMPWNTQQTVPSATPAQNDPHALSNAVSDIVDQNSSVMQRARAVANEQSNASGLLNSSMAVGAAENAVLNQAIPMAQGDVGAQEQNVSAQNAVIGKQLDQAGQIQLAGVNAQYRTVLDSNNNASTLYNNIMNQVSQIQNNGNMDATTKQTAISAAMQQLQSGLSMYSGMSGVDVAAGLNFSTK